MADVILARWPEERHDAARLAAAGNAVLYLVTGDADPPELSTCIEDWVRLPGDDRDLEARVALLRIRADVHGALPTLEPDGHLHFRGQVLAIPPDELDVAHRLVDRFGQTVADDEFGLDPSVLRSRMTRLRAQLRNVGLTVRRVRRQGYLLRRR